MPKRAVLRGARLVRWADEVDQSVFAVVPVSPRVAAFSRRAALVLDGPRVGLPSGLALIAGPLGLGVISTG